MSLLLTIGSWASNSYNKYEVANVELAQAIDSVMERANKMEYFSVLDNPYMIRISHSRYFNHNKSDALLYNTYPPHHQTHTNAS